MKSDHGIKITTSVALTQEEKVQITKRVLSITSVDAVVEFSIDEHLLGGIQIEKDGSLVDMTIRSELAEMVAMLDK